MPFVFLTLLVSREIGSDIVSRSAAATLITLSGIVQFYAGYIEVYAPLPILMLLTVWFSLKGERIPLLRYFAILTAFLALLVHPLCGILIPPTLYLVWFHDIQHRSVVIRVVVIAFIVIGAGIALSRGLNVISHFTLPLFPLPDTPYALLTVTNFWERLNGIILCSPAAIPLLPLIALRGDRGASSRSRFLWFFAGAGSFPPSPSTLSLEVRTGI